MFQFEKMVLKYVFGPVPSRRLGRSLGVNNLPSKICTYSCIYCQAGRTLFLRTERKPYSEPEKVAEEVSAAVEKLGGEIDYITFVPNGEPTLDLNIGKSASMIKQKVEVPLAILTNSSLLSDRSVREDLMVFDLVSLKVDSVVENTWRKINRPHKSLELQKILNGILEFSDSYSGVLLTETMLIEGVNSCEEEYLGVADFLLKLNVERAYVAVPTRPPAEPWVKPASEEELIKAYFIFKRKLTCSIELLTGKERGEFISLENPIESLLSITSVHPMRLKDAYRMLSREGDPSRILNELELRGEVKVVEYGGEKFVIRALKASLK